jgi:hypothetical protein
MTPNGPTGRQDEHDDTTITKDPESFVVNVGVIVTFVKSRRRFHARSATTCLGINEAAVRVGRPLHRG